jgi:hypothetical protein
VWFWRERGWREEGGDAFYCDEGAEGPGSRVNLGMAHYLGFSVRVEHQIQNAKASRGGHKKRH